MTASRIAAIAPSLALAGGRVVLSGGPFPTEHAGPVVRVGHADARLSFASRSRIAFVVPAHAVSGRQPVRLDCAPGETAFLEVGEVVATGVHVVDNPLVTADGTIYATCSGSRGQQTPVSIYRIVPGGGREVFSTGITNATSMALDPAGRLYVTSRFDGTVSRVGDNGRPEVVAGDLGVATGLVFAPDGTMYVGDRSGTVFRVSAGGDTTVHATLPSSVAAFHLALSPDGATLFATAPTMAPIDAVYRIAPDGRVSAVTRRFGRPQGLAFDPQGRLHVVEALAGASGVYRLDEDGRAEFVIASGPLVGIAFDPRGGVVVASNDTVYRLPGSAG